MIRQDRSTSETKNTQYIHLVFGIIEATLRPAM